MGFFNFLKKKKTYLPLDIRTSKQAICGYRLHVVQMLDENKFGVVRRNSEIMVPFEFDRVIYLTKPSESVPIGAYLVNDQTQKASLVLGRFHIIHDCTYFKSVNVDNLYSADYMKVQNENGLWGVVRIEDYLLRPVIPCMYSNIWNLSSCFCPVRFWVTQSIYKSHVDILSEDGVVLREYETSGVDVKLVGGIIAYRPQLKGKKASGYFIVSAKNNKLLFKNASLKWSDMFSNCAVVDVSGQDYLFHEGKVVFEGNDIKPLKVKDGYAYTFSAVNNNGFQTIITNDGKRIR